MCSASRRIFSTSGVPAPARARATRYRGTEAALSMPTASLTRLKPSRCSSRARPRLHWIRFHGVLGPNARLGSASVPRPAENDPAHCADHADTPGSAVPARIRWARLLKRVFEIDTEHCPLLAVAG